MLTWTPTLLSAGALCPARWKVRWRGCLRLVPWRAGRQAGGCVGAQTGRAGDCCVHAAIIACCAALCCAALCCAAGSIHLSVQPGGNEYYTALAFGNTGQLAARQATGLGQQALLTQLQACGTPCDWRATPQFLASFCIAVVLQLSPLWRQAATALAWSSRPP